MIKDWVEDDINWKWGTLGLYENDLIARWSTKESKTVNTASIPIKCIFIYKERDGTYFIQTLGMGKEIVEFFKNKEDAYKFAYAYMDKYKIKGGK